MRRCCLLKTSALVLFSFIAVHVNAQIDDFGSGDGYEITGVFGESKKKSPQENYNSKYKPGDVFMTLWYWAKELSKWLYGSGGKNSVELNEFDPMLNNLAEKKSGRFGVGLGLGLGTKGGGKYEFGPDKVKETIFYLQIPLLARYEHQFPNAGNIIAAFGPYYGIALSGKSKINDEKEDLKFGSDADADYKRGDFGLQFRLAFKPRSFPVSIGLTGDMGLRNQNTDDDVKIKNQFIGLLFGYDL